MSKEVVLRVLFASQFLPIRTTEEAAKSIIESWTTSKWGDGMIAGQNGSFALNVEHVIGMYYEYAPPDLTAEYIANQKKLIELQEKAIEVAEQSMNDGESWRNGQTDDED